jgi:CDP-L-myo-inositol myo-inositolphosphotransferase
MHIILLDGADPRFLAGSNRARNARVAVRAGATVSTDASVATGPNGPVVFVPADVALTTGLFDDPVFVSATARDAATRVQSPDGSFVVLASESAMAHAPDVATMAALPSRMISPGRLFNVATPANRRTATRAVLRATQKSTDGWVSRTFNRPVSRLFSRMALALGVSPTGASIATLLLGLLCASIAGQPGYVPLVATGLLFHLASVLDGVDGEIARATLTESPSGARIDTIVDQVTYVGCFVGVMIGWAREGRGAVAVVVAALTAVALVVSLLRAGRFVARHAENASFVFVDKAVRRAAVETGHVPLRVAAMSFTLLRRDLFAVIFLIASFTGIRALIPVLILAGVAIANVTFTVYSRELIDAASLERATA